MKRCKVKTNGYLCKQEECLKITLSVMNIPGVHRKREVVHFQRMFVAVKKTILCFVANSVIATGIADKLRIDS